jgi:hypothetical protein
MTKISNQYSLTNILTADLTNSRLGVNNTNPSHSLDLTGDARVGGSLIVTGNLTAQQFIVSSSVTYLTESFASGSHKFGDSSDDNHNFTGSLIVSGSANPLRVGSNLLFVSSSGFIGINNVSPTVALDVTGAGKFSSSVSATSYNATTQNIFSVDGTERMRITSAGNVGINISTPTARLEIFDNSNSGILRLSKDGGQQRGALEFGRNNGGSFQTCGSIIVDSDSASVNNGIMYFYTSNSAGTNTERMQIDSDGVVTIKGGKQLSIDSGVTGDAGLFIKSEGTNTTGFTNIQGFHGAVGFTSSIVMQRYGGNILMGTTSDNGERLYVSGAIRATGTITANSDISLKKNLLKIENALEKVEQINGYTYELKSDDSKRHGGVIAQEIDKVFPEIVNTGNDGLMGVEYGNISALLIEAIKEQQKAIQELSAENTSLINRIEALENK